MSHSQKSRSAQSTERRQTRKERRKAHLELSEWKRKYEHSQVLPEPDHENLSVSTMMR